MVVKYPSHVVQRPNQVPRNQSYQNQSEAPHQKDDMDNKYNIPD